LTNAKDADDKLVALKEKTDLYVYLEKHTVKDTLKPLLIRLQRRAIRGEDMVTLTVNTSSLMSIDVDEEEGIDEQLDYPPMKLHSRLNRVVLQSKGVSSLKKDGLLELICLIVTHVLEENVGLEKTLPVSTHISFVKRVLFGLGEDEPRLQCNEVLLDGKLKLDAESLWEDTTKNFLPKYEKTFWQKLMKH
jgi:hypothetical protein